MWKLFRAHPRGNSGVDSTQDYPGMYFSLKKIYTWKMYFFSLENMNKLAQLYYLWVRNASHFHKNMYFRKI